MKKNAEPAVKLEQAIDIFTWGKIEHIAAEQGRDVNEVAVELLEKEADRELARAGTAGDLVVAASGLSVRVEGGGAGGAVVVGGDGNKVRV